MNCDQTARFSNQTKLLAACHRFAKSPNSQNTIKCHFIVITMLKGRGIFRNFAIFTQLFLIDMRGRVGKIQYFFESNIFKEYRINVVETLKNRQQSLFTG